MFRSLLKDLIAQLRARASGAKGGNPATDAARLIQEGDECRRMAQDDRAKQCYARALAIDASNPHARYALAVTAGQAGEYAAASEHLRELLSTHPEHAGGWNALGNINKLQRRWEDAVACYRRAVGSDPQLASALSNLGMCLRNQGRAIEAMEYLERALALEPGNAEILFNSYLVMTDSGRVEEGELGLARVLEQQPEHAEAHLALACQLLAGERFSEGWREYEWRNRIESWERRNAEYSYPWWNGEDLAKRRLLVRAEQGLGDQIMFASCLRDLLERDVRLILECDPRLQPIFARSFPGAAVYAGSRSVAGAWANDGLIPELQVNIGSLPYLLNRGHGAFPAHHGYLSADPSKVETWRERLANLGTGPKIGVSWRGGTWTTRQLARSLALHDLSPILKTENARFISLQYGDCAAEIATLKREEGIALHHWHESIDDYDETAALLCALDLVISVQTAVVHLGGALGKPVWVMVAARPEWRYLRQGDTMPWYPSVKLIRQPSPNEWKPVIDRVGAELGGFIRTQRNATAT